jgi:hypothetical protein
MTTGDIRPVYQEFLDALVQLDKCLKRGDFESRLYQHLRKKVDELAAQLTKKESEDAYWFSLSLDNPGEGSSVPRGPVD